MRLIILWHFVAYEYTMLQKMEEIKQLIELHTSQTLLTVKVDHFVCFAGATHRQYDLLPGHVLLSMSSMAVLDALWSFTWVHLHVSQCCKGMYRAHSAEEIEEMKEWLKFVRMWWWLEEAKNCNCWIALSIHCTFWCDNMHFFVCC